MLLTSVFSFECICGRQIETEVRSCECPSCHRQLVIEWGKQDVEPQPARQTDEEDGAMPLTEYSIEGIL